MQLLREITVGADIDLSEAKNWKPEWLIWAVIEKTRANVTQFLGAKGNITFSFDDLVKKIWKLITIDQEQDSEKILGILACLCMRLHLEEISWENKKLETWIGSYSQFRQSFQRWQKWPEVEELEKAA